MNTALFGFLTGATLILSIGAQNAFVLRQGLRREHVGVVVGICSLSDVVLISAGVAMVGLLRGMHPAVLTVLTYGGAAYLAYIGFKSLLAAREATGLAPTVAQGAGSVALTTIALTWLNPHVYLDTVLMLGSVANEQGPLGRWQFAAGAILASLIWFPSIAFGARALAPRLSHPATWRVIDLVVGVTMLVIAAGLVLAGPRP